MANIPNRGDAEVSLARVALVTGGARRVGRVIALELARQGWDIAIHCGHSAAEAKATAGEIAALGRRAGVFEADLEDSSQVEALLGRCEDELGAVHCVVNSASRFEFDDASHFDRDALDRQMHVNVAAPILLARELHRRCVARDEAGLPAVVINLLDQKLFNLNPDFLSYTLSKAALQAATITLAQALAPWVRVVGVAPGITMPSADQSQEEFAAAHKATPLGRSSEPEDIARAVCYLASARAITGTTLIVDGGQHLVPTLRDIMFLAK